MGRTTLSRRHPLHPLMPEVAFPPFAEDFIDAVGTFFSKFERAARSWPLL
jgi:hypothetical protein